MKDLFVNMMSGICVNRVSMTIENGRRVRFNAETLDCTDVDKWAARRGVKAYSNGIKRVATSGRFTMSAYIGATCSENIKQICHNCCIEQLDDMAAAWNASPMKHGFWVISSDGMTGTISVQCVGDFQTFFNGIRNVKIDGFSRHYDEECGEKWIHLKYYTGNVQYAWCSMV